MKNQSAPAQLRDRPSGAALLVPGNAVGATVTVGRAGDCDVVLRNWTVSRHHALLRQDGSSWMVQDLRSTNGTAVNGSAITQPTPLHSGDIVSFGASAVRFVPTQLA
ncbi:MAG: hypothetical protein QOG63_801 [Thermoleophilaceae bacterium]|jgi:pSer/pThr/pTyr-binding forkhead associated (FHA) protein|nr:hypothetical protein [Thermoleophilaceae bacterium]